MSRPAADCPQCGARLEFRFSSAVQTVCPYCRAILVRHDVNLDLVGTAADLPPDSSPIQLRTEGLYRNKAFWVTGRILYQYERGRWNEWHLAFQDGASGWLSDAQAEYALSFPFPPPEPLPPAELMHTNRLFQFDGATFQVTAMTEANYAGVEGELPFEYWDKEKILFADLRAENGRFGTIDYSEPTPLLFLGEILEFDQLRFKNLRAFEGW